MKKIKGFTQRCNQYMLGIVAATSSGSIFANSGGDLLANALSGEVAGSLGNGATFWKIFILVDIILATAMAVKSKNPMVFVGVAGIAFIPAFLLKTFVF
jgi:hypothetical protein